MLAPGLQCMKVTIEIDDELYRQVKAAAAMKGRKAKDLETGENVLASQGLAVIGAN